VHLIRNFEFLGCLKVEILFFKDINSKHVIREKGDDMLQQFQEYRRRTHENGGEPFRRTILCAPSVNVSWNIEQ